MISSEEEAKRFFQKWATESSLIKAHLTVDWLTVASRCSVSLESDNSLLVLANTESGFLTDIPLKNVTKFVYMTLRDAPERFRPQFEKWGYTQGWILTLGPTMTLTLFEIEQNET